MEDSKLYFALLAISMAWKAHFVYHIMQIEKLFECYANRSSSNMQQRKQQPSPSINYNSNIPNESCTLSLSLCAVRRPTNISFKYIRYRWESYLIHRKMARALSIILAATRNSPRRKAHTHTATKCNIQVCWQQVGRRRWRRRRRKVRFIW